MVIIIIVLVFILFDILTGLIKAIYKEGLNSTYLRQGLFHKLSEILALIGSYLLEYAIKYIELGIDIPILKCVSGYIALMELISIIENLCEVNPKLNKLFAPYLEKMKGEKKDAEGD